jgi:hypothetical protein
MRLLYAVVWCIVAIALVTYDWGFWRGSAPELATVHPAYETEHPAHVR